MELNLISQNILGRIIGCVLLIILCPRYLIEMFSEI